MRRRGGNDSSIPVSRWVVPASVPETPPTTVTFKNSSLLGRQSDTASLGENRGSPPKTVSRCRLHNLSFYFIFNIFFQFNYLVTLINRYDCSACNLCARHLICSGSGRGGGFCGYCFSSFMMAGASDQLLPTSLFYHRGGFETKPMLPVLRLITSLFLWWRPTCSKVEVVCWALRAWKKKPSCGNMRHSFEMSLLHDVSHQKPH